MADADCRVLSWNLWWRFGDWRARLPGICTTVADAAPDVVALQEAWWTDSSDQPRLVAEAAGLEHIAMSPSRRSDWWRSRLPQSEIEPDLQCGLAVLSRWPIVASSDIELPIGQWESRGRTAVVTTIDHPRGLLTVVNTHLEAHPARSGLRVQQLEAVAHLVHAENAVDVERRLAPIVCGDFNAEPHSDEVRRFSGLQTDPFVEDQAFWDAWQVAVDQDPGWTWRKDCPYIDTGNPNARVDYVFVGLSGRVVDARLVGTDRVTWPSDHAGVLADIRP